MPASVSPERFQTKKRLVSTQILAEGIFLTANHAKDANRMDFFSTHLWRGGAHLQFVTLIKNLKFNCEM
jgi:hypothetical protein